MSIADHRARELSAKLPQLGLIYHIATKNGQIGPDWSRMIGLITSLPVHMNNKAADLVFVQAISHCTKQHLPIISDNNFQISGDPLRETIYG